MFLDPSQNAKQSEKKSDSTVSSSDATAPGSKDGMESDSATDPNPDKSRSNLGHFVFSHATPPGLY